MSELDLEKLKADCAAAKPDKDGFVNASAVTRILNTAIDVIPMLIAEVELLRTENAGLRQQLAACQATRIRIESAALVHGRGFVRCDLCLAAGKDADDIEHKAHCPLATKPDHAALGAALAAARRDGCEEAAKWSEIRARALREEAQARSSPFAAAFCDLLAAEIERATNAIRALPLEEDDGNNA